MVSRGSGRGLSRGRTSRRNTRNLQWMQRPVNKSAGRSRAQCVQGTVEQRRREKGHRLGNGSTRKWATSVTGTGDRTASRRESRDRTRLPRDGEPGHPGSSGLSAQIASTARSAMHIVGETLPENTYKRAVIRPARR